MKKLFGCVCVCRLLFLLFIFSTAFSGLSPSFGNNIRVEGKTRIVNFVGTDTAVIEVNLRWDNSWRDDFNWDAAWVFFKFKKRGLENPWQHAYLSSSGHVLTPGAGNEGGGYAYMVGANGGKVNGLYIMRSGISEGNVSVRLQVKWSLSGTGLTKSDFGDALNGVYVAVHAIEMVYIPYGAYYLGDASSYRSFAVGDTAAVVIDSEDALTLSARNGMPNVSLAASYPKGYAGFYVMKYETSQEQYVEFLNSLTLEQQKARVMNNNFSAMKKGDYVFGDLKTPNCRNGIAFVEQKQSNAPVVFGNNLNPNNDFFSTDDGQTLACNYMSVEDMIVYCSWSGLRPMSELEYEKACRRFYPQLPDKGEYAWNTNSGVNRLNSLGDLSYRGDQREQAVSYLKNVNSGTTNGINGPVRCGLFATSATNQTQAGATYWGVMEMSGNLKELCVSVGNPNYNGASCGTGVYNAAYWNTAVGSYGVRGGGFSSADSTLRTSDRTEAMNYFTTITQRDSTVGFRGVYSLSGIKIDGGEIKMSQDTACWGETDVLNVAEASCPDFPDVRFQYNWYVKKPGEAKFDIIPNAGGMSLTYEHFENKTASPVVYTFRRTGICAMGVAESNEVTVKILPKPFAQEVYDFNAGSSVTLTQYWGTTASAQWRLEGAPVWANISGLTSGSLTISGGFVSVEFTLKAKLAQCPANEFSAAIKVSDRVPYTGHMESITVAPGKYKMMCWGAGGGRGYVNYNSSNGDYYPGANGGYAEGVLDVSVQTTFYVYVGGAGGSSPKKTGGAGGWNGGGQGGGDEGDDCGGGGGGATDIRKNGTSLSNRILVAGGGGGGAGAYGKGGTGGGNSGGYGGNYNSPSLTTPGTQSSGYSLGSGGSGAYGGTNYCGGGGGYYGGYGGTHGNGKGTRGGGGGSGYVSGIFTNASMSNGANSGNGYVRIVPVN